MANKEYIHSSPAFVYKNSLKLILVVNERKLYLISIMQII